jgi:hypothetical protein
MTPMTPSSAYKPSPMHNITGLTQDERTLVEAAKEAWKSLKRTFDQWITLGRGIACLRERANQVGGRNTFQRLMEENGLGELILPKSKAVVSKLEKIMKPENLDRVQQWHNGLPPVSQVAWASPSSIMARCPVFATPKPNDKPKAKPSLLEENKTLSEQVEQFKARAQEQDEELASAKTLKTVEPKSPASNPLRGMTFGQIVDLILELPKSTVKAIAHDLSREAEPKRGKPKAEAKTKAKPKAKTKKAA